jgi:predicted small secreted protein
MGISAHPHTPIASSDISTGDGPAPHTHDSLHIEGNHMKHLTKRLDRLVTLALATLIGVLGISLTACNTTEGVGKDIEAAGDGIQDAAD